MAFLRCGATTEHTACPACREEDGSPRGRRRSKGNVTLTVPMYGVRQAAHGRGRRSPPGGVPPPMECRTSSGLELNGPRTNRQPDRESSHPHVLAHVAYTRASSFEKKEI